MSETTEVPRAAGTEREPGRGRRAARLAVLVVALLAAVLVTRVVVAAVLSAVGVPGPVGDVVTAAAVLGAYVLLVRRVEHRRVDELSRPGAVRALASGALIGFGLFTLLVAIFAVTGLYRIDGTGSVGALWTALGTAVLAGVVEELVFRAVLFRFLERAWGTWPALAISALVFGGLHLVNPGATVLSVVAIAVQAGTLLALAYVATRRLWVPIGLHVAWNAAQSGVFGVPTSGIAADGLLRGSLSGPTLLSGGDFGMEGSVLTVVVCLVAAAAFAVVAHRRGLVVPTRRADRVAA